MENNLFQQETVSRILKRINNLTPDSAANWGKMNVSQMLAHCNVTYEMVYENEFPELNASLKNSLKKRLISKVMTDRPYPKNEKTAPQYLIEGSKDFSIEKQRLIGYIEKTKSLGEEHFDGKESHSFGRLNKEEWNNMFFKHLDHHLNQFGV